MTLSEAIRVGAKMRPQYFDGWWTNRNGDGVSATCALGGAYEAMFGVDDIVRNKGCVTRRLFEAFPELLSLDTSWKCPDTDCSQTSSLLAALIGHLNDHHRWTREAVADFVESFEAAERKAA